MQTIIINPDWKLGDVLAHASGPDLNYSSSDQHKIQFIKQAIDNRPPIKDLVIESYEKAHKENINKYKISLDDDLISELLKEGSKKKLSLEEYIRAIVYTKAREETDRRIEKQKAAHKRMVFSPFKIEDVVISDSLLNKLYKKFPLSEDEKLNKNNNKGTFIVERLVKIAEDHLN